MNIWLNRKKTGRLSHLTHGFGWADIHLPAIYPVTDIWGRFPDIITVVSHFGRESDRKLIWFDEDLFILDGRHYQRHDGSFFNVRERRLGVFFNLTEIKDAQGIFHR